MTELKCNFCGSDRHEERRIGYLCGCQGEHLLVPNTPVEVCLDCGRIYQDAAVLKEIERRFFAIQNKSEEPDGYISMPEKSNVGGCSRLVTLSVTWAFGPPIEMEIPVVVTPA